MLQQTGFFRVADLCCDSLFCGAWGFIFFLIAVAVSFLVKSHSHRFLLESDRDLKKWCLFTLSDWSVWDCQLQSEEEYRLPFPLCESFPFVYMQSLVRLRNTSSMRSVSNLLTNSLTYTVVVRLLFSQDPAMFACAASSKDILSFLIPLLKASWITTIQCVIHNLVVDPFLDGF